MGGYRSYGLHSNINGVEAVGASGIGMEAVTSYMMTQILDTSNGLKKIQLDICQKRVRVGCEHTCACTHPHCPALTLRNSCCSACTVHDKDAHMPACASAAALQRCTCPEKSGTRQLLFDEGAI